MLAFGVILGTAGVLVLPAIDGWPLITGACLLGCLIVICKQRWILGVAFVAGALLGVWRGAGQSAAMRLYEPYIDRIVSVQGTLQEDATMGSRGDQRFVLKHIRIDGRPLPAEIWISGQAADIKRGDIVTVQGRLSEGFGTFPATIGRGRITKIERPKPGDIARVARDAFAEAVRRNIQEPAASLGIGYLTGQRSTLPAEFDDQLQAVGLTHAVVASGYNLTILVSFARSMLQGISKYLAAVAAGGMVLLFMMITGLSPSMSRAGLVAGLSLLAWYYGRVVHPLVLLPVAAAVTLLVRPAYAWGDIGWCLSFTAFAGVIILSPLIKRYFWEPGDDPPALLQLVIDTIAAQLATLPIILFCFGQLPVYALPANLLVLPLVPLAMACTFAAGIAGLFLPAVAAFIALPAQWLLSYMVWVIGKIAMLPGAQEEISFGTTGLIVGYAILGIVSIYLWFNTKLDFRGDITAEKNV